MTKKALYLTVGVIVLVAVSFATGMVVAHWTSGKQLLSSPVGQGPGDESSPTLAVTTPRASGSTVYITRTGRKYHQGSCHYLRRSKIPISLSDAKARGYTPCSVCGPPE